MTKDDGFSLIEQLAALIILSIAVLLVVPFLTSNLQNVKEEDFKVKVTNLAQELVEATRSVPFDELADGTYEAGGAHPEPATLSLAEAFTEFETKVTDADYIPGGGGSLIIQPASAVTDAAEIKEVIVNVQWEESGQTKDYELPTYVYEVSRE